MAHVAHALSCRPHGTFCGGERLPPGHAGSVRRKQSQAQSATSAGLLGWGGKRSELPTLITKKHQPFSGTYCPILGLETVLSSKEGRNTGSLRRPVRGPTLPGGILHVESRVEKGDGLFALASPSAWRSTPSAKLMQQRTQRPCGIKQADVRKPEKQPVNAYRWPEFVPWYSPVWGTGSKTPAPDDRCDQPARPAFMASGTSISLPVLTS